MNNKEWLTKEHPQWDAICDWVALGNDPKKLRDKFKISMVIMYHLQSLMNKELQQ